MIHDQYCFFKFVLKWQILLQQVGIKWDDSLQSKEKIQAKLLNKQVVVMRREKDLADALSHQVKDCLFYGFYFRF